MRDRPRCNACKAEFPLLGRWRVHGARCTHSSEFMPYRDPAKRATWMRQYWQRKRLGQVSVPASLSSRPSVVRAPEPSRVWRPTIQKQHAEALKRRQNWRELFLSEPLPRKYARIAIPTVRPAHGAAVVEVVRDESGEISLRRDRLRSCT